MHRKITLLAGVALLAGCSGGTDGSTSVDTTDRAAPVITLSPSSGSIEGGETVAITATANDVVDGVLTPTLSCNGGTLTGNLLVTSTVAADTTITCTGTATDKAGNVGTATTTITVKATVSRLTSLTASTLTQGQVGGFLVENIALTADTYSAKLGGRDLTIYRGTASALSFFVPTDMPVGTHRLDFQVGDKRFTHELTVTAAASIADPKAVITTYLNDSIARLNAMLASEGSALSAAERNSYIAFRTELQTRLAEIDAMSAADRMAFATALQANLSTGVIARTYAVAMNAKDCDAAMVNFTLRKAAAIALVGGGGAVFAKAPGYYRAIGAVMVGFGLYWISGVTTAVVDLVDKCVITRTFDFVGGLFTSNVMRVNYVQATDVAVTYGFENRKSKSFTLVETLSMEATVAARATAGVKEISDLIAQLPGSLPSWKADLEKFTTKKVKNVPSSQVTLGTVSDPKILGVKSGSGETVTLTFSYVGDPPSENVPFTFNLLSGTTNIPLSGQLVVALPGAEDAAITLVQGKAVTSQVQVRGAESIEIVKQGSKGTASITTAGALTYTPTGQAFGSDEIQYRARNANGVSRTATILVTINRQFEGTWSVNIRSTTTSQSSSNLCPNENSNVSVMVSKVSDTQYSANYDGVPLSFTMASRDDPNGLRAQISGTFDDGPGQTTESLTINIPNSTQLNGGSTWSYAGPGGARCAGTTTVTGTK